MKQYVNKECWQVTQVMCVACIQQLPAQQPILPVAKPVFELQIQINTNS